MNPNLSSKALFEDDKYMRPVLEDDVLLYSLDDISEERPPDSTEGEGVAAESKPAGSAEIRIRELQEELERIRGQFAEYQMVVKRSLDNQLSTLGEELSHPSSTTGSSKFREAEAGYFTSYSYNGMFIMSCDPQDLIF